MLTATIRLLRPPLPLRSAAGIPRIHSLPPPTLTGFTPSRTLYTLSVSTSRFFVLTNAVCAAKEENKWGRVTARASSSDPPLTEGDSSDKEKLSQVSKRLENTARYFQRLGSLGFWGQLVSTAAAAVILSFSAFVSGRVTSPATFYATAGGIVAAFVSVFWSFGYIRLSKRLQRSATNPSKAPPRAEVVKNLKNGILVNIVGMGAAVLGMQATVGLLVAKALTTSPVPYYQGIPPGQNPVLALDIFLVQASANTILSHFLGILFSLELLQSVTLSNSDSVLISKPL